jgi:hypothetical protein
MDLRLFARVLWRFRLLTACGFLAAAVLATLSYATVEFDGGVPTLRAPGKAWQSDATLFVTEQGAPWGRSVLDSPARAAAGSAPAFSDPSRFIGLAALYARLADSDEVRRILLRDGPIRGAYGAVPVKSSDGSTLLPMIAVLGYGASPAAAVEIANRAAAALQTYLREEQRTNRIPARQRVELPFLNEARRATVFDTPSPVKPVFLFLLVAGLTAGLAFVLENLRPRSREALPGEDARTTQTAPIARSA